jgi:multidrug efflux pump
MNLSEPFVRRPIATALLTIGLAFAGVAAFFQLAVAPLPQIDLPTVAIQANLPGANPTNMATSVAAPLERHLGLIADVTEMTSSSRTGSSQVVLQFGLDRNIDGAARDVQAAINAARVDLPATLRSTPNYRKINPAAFPIVILALTSPTRTPGQIYDAASNIVQQKLSQISGVGDVSPMGASLPAVRVELIPNQLTTYGIGLEDVRAAITSANANRPRGLVQDSSQRLQIYTNDSGTSAADYKPLIIAYRKGAAVRLEDVAQVVDGQEDVHNLGLFNGQPAVIVTVTGQPGANVIATVDAIKAELPRLQAALPADITMNLAVDRTTSIRAALKGVEKTLLISVLLVVVVVVVFLRTGASTLVPAVAVVVSLLGTLGVMFLLGFSLDNLSLMALTVSTGFVVDDAIVVLENITRHVEQGMKRFDAALLGAKEVGFTVLSISISLVAVFMPILLMGGIPGRLFREFAITLAAAIIISLLISLTTTPMLCAYLVRRPAQGARRSLFGRLSQDSFEAMTRIYERALRWSLDSGPVMITIFVLTIILNLYLIRTIPFGFFPQQSNGLLAGFMQSDQDTSFRLTQQRLTRFVNIIHDDPAVKTVTGFTGGRSAGGQVFIGLKPLSERSQVSDDQVIARLRLKLLQVSGASLFLQSIQDLGVGGRQGFAQFQYTLKAGDLDLLKAWAAKLADELKRQPSLADVNSDQENHGLENYVTIDRVTAARLGLSAVDVDNNLYDAFGQRQVSTIYRELNQYHVIMEAGPDYNQQSSDLDHFFVSTNAAAKTAGASTATINALAARATTFAATPGGPSVAGGAQITLAGPTAPPGRNAANGVAVSAIAERMVPLAAIVRHAPSSAPVSVNHTDGSASTTISFNLQPGVSISDAVAVINQAQETIHMPIAVQGSFQGTARAFQQAFGSEPVLILTALLTVYIVLGVLYESYVHPLTVLSTLPSAFLGASLALILFKTELSLIALLGFILLIGIVKKNAIMMIDFALEAERSQGLSTREAIYQAAMLRFRPIMMTTFAAILGALPLVIASGEGSEIRRPLGITIIGGLMVSQVLTLLTTPVVYLYMDRWRRPRGDQSHLSRVAGAPSAQPDPA